IADFGFERGIGPGVYDIHSPRVPTVPELVELIEAALKHVPPHRLWIYPDCGLKTRGYAEVRASLANLIAARDRVVAAGLPSGAEAPVSAVGVCGCDQTHDVNRGTMQYPGPGLVSSGGR